MSNGWLSMEATPHLRFLLFLGHFFLPQVRVCLPSSSSESILGEQTGLDGLFVFNQVEKKV
jgi:hypothetical protein